MSLPTEISLSIQLACGLSSAEAASPRLAATPETDHAATLEIAADLMQSLYDLAGELRGLGPAAHAKLKESGAQSPRRRLQEMLDAIEALHGDLAAVRGPVLHRQLLKLGVDGDSRRLNVHIGCGRHHLAGWINIDNYPAPLAANIANGLPLPDCSAQYVFLSHLLEHLFYPNESDRLIREIRRVLEPGGVVRIVVPDIEQCIRAYANDDEAFFAARREHWTWLPKESTHLEKFLAYAGAGPTPAALFEHHKFGYDFLTLQRCLERAGFVEVRRCGYQQSPHPELRVDHASANASAKHGDQHFSLFVEAKTPV